MKKHLTLTLTADQQALIRVSLLERLAACEEQFDAGVCGDLRERVNALLAMLGERPANNPVF